MRQLASLFLAVTLAAPAAAAERPWIEVRSPHFAVVSQSGEAPARDIAWQFEQVRSVFATLWPWARRTEDRPFVVFLVRDEPSLRQLARNYDFLGMSEPSALYVTGADADYVLLRSDVRRRTDARVNLYMTAFEGYADTLLVRQFRSLPLWFRDGFGEVLANTLVRDKDVEIGRVIPWHLELLTGRPAEAFGRSNPEDRRTTAPGTVALIPLPRLMAIRRGDPEDTGDAPRRLFAAQSWAFVHYLMFGEGGARRAKFNRLANLLHAGSPAEQAVAETLGDVAALAEGFHEYLKQRTLQFQRVDIDVYVRKEKWPARPLPEAEAAELTGQVQATVDPRRTPPERRAAPAPRTPAAPASAQSLIVACNEGDDESCLRLAVGLQAACESGDAPSCMPLGWLYVKGRGVQLDVLKGEAYYARACDAGEAKACFALANSLLDRSEEPADQARAAQLRAKACAGGVAAACGR
jgi:hypothetical protein